MIADVAADKACLDAVLDASRLLESLGHEIVDIEAPLPHEAVPVFETCWSVLTAMSLVPPEQESLLRPLTRWLTERGRAVSGPDFGLAIGEMRRFAAGALTTLAPYDAVLTPTLATPPLPVGAIRNDDDPEADFEAQKRFTPWTSAWNVTGMPAASLPLAWTDDGLPVGGVYARRPSRRGGRSSACAHRSRRPLPGSTGGRPDGERRTRAHTAELTSGDLAALLLSSRQVLRRAMTTGLTFGEVRGPHRADPAHAALLRGPGPGRPPRAGSADGRTTQARSTGCTHPSPALAGHTP